MSVMTPPPVNAKRIQRTSAEEAVRELQDQLQATRSRLITQRTWLGICLIATGFFISVAVSATADYLWELSTVWRTTWLAGSFATAALIAVLAWKHWISQYTLSNAAADAEQRLSQFGQRLRTTLDYEQRTPQPAAASPSLLKALHLETHRVSEKIEWDDAIDPQPLWKAFCFGLVIACTWLVAFIAAPEFRIATARAFALPFDYTTVTFSPQHETVKFGESVVVKANVAGRPITAAHMRYRPAGSTAEWKTVNLAPPDQTPESELVATETKDLDAVEEPVLLHGELVAKLSDLKQDLEFVVVAGPRDLSPGSIRVLQPLKLEKSRAHIVPPSYTGRKAENVKSLSLKVLEGSNVELMLTLNRSASEAKLTRIETGSTADKPAEASTANSASTTPEIPIRLDGNLAIAALTDLRNNAAFTFSARADDGMTLDPVKVSIRVQKDRKPQVEFVQPEEELVVTPTTEVPFVVNASDDLGLQKVGIMYQIGSGSMKTLVEQSAEGAIEPFQLNSLLMLEDHDVVYPEAVSYFAFAEDNYFGKPRRTVTPLRYIDIRAYKQEFQVVDAQGGSCNGCSVTLEELITRQRQNLSKTFAMQDEPSPEKAGTQRLLTYEKEILDATNEFAMGLKERGMEVPSLDKATTMMDEAVTALEAPKLPEATTKEQRALAALIDARQNLRKLLKQSNSQSASACRKFDRQQRQKLRMPEKKQEDQQQQVASARAKLEDLAKRERKWSEEAKTSCQNPSNSSSKPSKPSQSKPSQSSSSPSQQAQSSQQSQQSPAQQNSEQQQSQQQANQESKSSSPAKTPAEVAAEQEKLQAELAQLQKELDKLGDKGKSSEQQAQQAAESMQQGLDELKKQDGEAAAKAGERSADQLERLSEHLAAMNAKDFGQRLEQAQKLAQQLAGRQEAVAKDLGQGKKGQQKAGQSAEGQSESAPDQKEGSGAARQPGQKASPTGEGQGDQPSQSASSGEGDAATENPSSRPGRGRSAEKLAREERDLAVQTEMLADLLDRLKGDAAAEDGGVRDKLQQAHAENPPREIAADMRQAAADLQASRTSEAGRGAAQARDQLDELSKLLSAARGEYAQPQLKELMELEEKLAQLQKELQRTQGQESKDANAANQKWQQVEPRLDQMAQSDRRLADALQQLREGKPGQEGQGSDPKASQPGNATPKPGSKLQPTPYLGGQQQLPDGVYDGVRLGNTNGLRGISKVLQAKIQEAILAAALLDADQPVPPAYKELVEKYYRTLSDDLK